MSSLEAVQSVSRQSYRCRVWQMLKQHKTTRALSVDGAKCSLTAVLGSRLANKTRSIKKLHQALNTYTRSAFLGIPRGTVRKPWPWQSTWDPEQLHLWGHPSTATQHSNPQSSTRLPQHLSAVHLPRAETNISAANKIKLKFTVSNK